jgi:predicted O-linked N-acetylglucosamine transferase (SPINDLY family)
MSAVNRLDEAMQYHREGRLSEAAGLYCLILDEQSDHFDALHLLGTIAYLSGNNRLAIELINRAIVLIDSRPEPYYHLGLVLLHMGQLEEAAAQFRRALDVAPAFAPAHHHLGLVHERQGHLEAAAGCFQLALECEPTAVGPLHRLAEVYLSEGRTKEAIPLFQKALSISPNDAALHIGLADAWHVQDELAKAIATYKQAAALDPRLVQAWWGMGCAESARGEYTLSTQSLQKVVELAPAHGEAWHNLGKSRFQLGQTDLALDAFHEAASRLHSNEMTLGMIATVIPGSPRTDQQGILKARRAWAARCGSVEPNRGFSRSRASDTGRLRVGYVSAFFQNNNWMKPVWGLINHHDRDRFDIHLFSDSAESSIQHSYTKRPRDCFHDVSRLSNPEMARLIEELAIDILVDLNGYSRISRLPLFALRPAPVIIAWFNMFATSGMDGFDYLIGDEHVFNVGEAAFFSERVVTVPGCYLSFEVTYPVPDVAPQPCLERGVFTFGCLAPQYKITPEVVEVWSRILRGSPNSRFLLKNVALASAANRRFVHSLFNSFGAPPDRVELDGPTDHFEFLKKYGEMDLALDTFPYNGGTTTMEALWQGVPVLTYYGDRWASRISASLLRSAQLAEFVAPDLEGYVAQAIEIARSNETPGRLDNMRRVMRNQLCQAPVCNVGEFARNMEREYLRMWQAGDVLR